MLNLLAIVTIIWVFSLNYKLYRIKKDRNMSPIEVHEVRNIIYNLFIFLKRFLIWWVITTIILYIFIHNLLSILVWPLF